MGKNRLTEAPHVDCVYVCKKEVIGRNLCLADVLGA